MKLHPNHNGQRMRKKHWSHGQYFIIKVVGRSTVVANDETGKEIIFERDEMDNDWEILGRLEVLNDG